MECTKGIWDRSRHIVHQRVHAEVGWLNYFIMASLVLARVYFINQPFCVSYKPGVIICWTKFPSLFEKQYTV